ncbi:phenylalanine--tRNA ligase subunit alpha [Devriesea agamarum]|uniref:phenylalanine--tRNA ligase subunit alpha n=1 Tax=Devriesea agamarum TaxID=472569 RepID=UPI0009FFFF74
MRPPHTTEGPIIVTPSPDSTPSGEGGSAITPTSTPTHGGSFDTDITPEVIDAAVCAALADIEQASGTAELKTVRQRHIGDGSVLATAGRRIGALPKELKASVGKLVGQAKGRVNKALADRQAVLSRQEEEAALAAETVDVCLPTDRNPRGALHPLSILSDRIADFFVGLGWEIAEGPEIEAEWFNFDALNFDVDHPARQMQDTFYVASSTHQTGAAGGDGHNGRGAEVAQGADASGAAEQASGLVLRTHTSPVQARSLLERGVPLYIACPGRTFRTDELDATHTPVFHQVEGLAIDEGLTMANLKGTLDAFAAAMFGPGTLTRLRPSYFPFTEPSAEMDFRCFACTARNGLDHDAAPDCRVCGGTGWIEWGGCGMVNPAVLRACGIDPERYQGFAFGMGIERTLMLRNGVQDMHDMVEGDVRFSQHYGTEI